MFSIAIKQAYVHTNKFGHLSLFESHLEASFLYKLYIVIKLYNKFAVDINISPNDLLPLV